MSLASAELEIIEARLMDVFNRLVLDDIKEHGMVEAVVMTAQSGKGKNPWGRYRRVAVVIVKARYRPQRIQAKNKNVARILYDSPRNFYSKTDGACQYTRTVKYAERVADDYNQLVNAVAKSALRNRARRPLP